MPVPTLRTPVNTSIEIRSNIGVNTSVHDRPHEVFSRSREKAGRHPGDQRVKGHEGEKADEPEQREHI